MKTEAMTTQQVATVTGATYRQLDYWATSGVFGPKMAAKGTGHPRQWDAPQVVLAFALTLLSDVAKDGNRRAPRTGIALIKRLRGIEREVRKVWDTDPNFAQYWLVVEARSVKIVQGPLYIKAAFVVDLQMCAHYVHEMAA